MEKLVFTTQAAAQTMADACHAYLVANDISYGGSVGIGQTTAWSIPQPDGTYDAQGNFTPNGDWYIWVEEQLAPVDPLIAALFPAPQL